MLELEEINIQAEIRKFYQKINKSRKEFKPRITICRDKEKNIVRDKENIMNRWAENFEEKLNVRQEEVKHNEIDDKEKETPRRKEIQRAIKRLKNNKSAGSNEIPSELLKKGGELILYT